MAQEFDPEKMSKPIPEGHVKPQDPVDVYATEKDPFHDPGEKFTVHKVLAKKLVKSGKATMKAPAPEKKADK